MFYLRLIKWAGGTQIREEKYEVSGIIGSRLVILIVICKATEPSKSHKSCIH